MKVIDAHTHLLAPEWVPLAIRRAWARQAAARRHPARDPEEILPRVVVGQSDPTGELTSVALARAGVSAAVCPVIDWSRAAGQRPDPGDVPIRDVNRLTAEACEASAGRLFHCAGVDPRHPEARTLVEEALAAPTARGLKLYPATGWHLDDPAHAWQYDLLLETGGVAMVHSSPRGGEPLIPTRSRPGEIAAVLAHHPDLVVVLAHAGFDAWWMEAAEIATGRAHAYLELSLWQELADRDYPEFRRRVRLIVGLVGAHRTIFGSDTLRGTATDPDGRELQRWVDQWTALAEPFAGDAAVLSGEQLALAMAGNAARVYGIHDW